MIDLKSSSLLIVGGSGGLGSELVSQLIDSVKVIHVVGRDRAKLLELKSKSPAVCIHQCDITSSKQVESLVSDIGNIDILINSAGVWLEGPVEKNSYEQIDEVIRVNINGAIYCARAVLSNMIRNNKGVIINVSSTSGLYGRENHAVYAATKYALRGFTESLKNDLSGTDVKVIGVYPGGMKTQIFLNAGFDRDTTGFIDPKEVAEAISYILNHINNVIIDHIVLNRVDK